MAVERLSDGMRRAAAGMTQREIAAAIGCDQALVSRLLNGHVRPGRRVGRAIVRRWPELREAVLIALLEDDTHSTDDSSASAPESPDGSDDGAGIAVAMSVPAASGRRL